MVYIEREIYILLCYDMLCYSLKTIILCRLAVVRHCAPPKLPGRVQSGVDELKVVVGRVEDTLGGTTKRRPTRQWHRGKGVLERNQGS